MSYDATAQAIQTTGPKGPAKLVLILLAHHLNAGTGKCCPSVTTLAEEAGMKRQTVIDALKTLEAGGWITSRKTAGKATNYVLDMQPVPETAPADQCRNRHYTSAENGTAPVPKTAPEQGSNREVNKNPPTPLRGGGGRRIPTGTNRTTVHRTETPSGSTRARTLVQDLTDTSWADV
ncbi:MAG: helix-turn-helix domain protein [Microviridae sp.]|nr:MAG: helix-turn-helix domain protein [Microviridae sp.]